MLDDVHPVPGPSDCERYNPARWVNCASFSRGPELARAGGTG